MAGEVGGDIINPFFTKQFEANQGWELFLELRKVVMLSSGGFMEFIKFVEFRVINGGD